MFKKIVFASGNLSKKKEICRLIKPWDIDIISQSEFNVPSIEETGLSFVENALLKARNCSMYTSLPVISDDSGLCINALSGNPGIYSARYSGQEKNDKENIKKVLFKMKKNKERKAYLYCALVFIVNHKDSEPIISTGKLEGTISENQSGKMGFGYDSIFYLPNYKKNLGELNNDFKDMISHRSKAILKMKSMIVKKMSDI